MSPCTADGEDLGLTQVGLLPEQIPTRHTVSMSHSVCLQKPGAMLSRSRIALLLQQAPECCELWVRVRCLRGAAHVGLSNLRWREWDSLLPGDTEALHPTPSGLAPLAVPMCGGP